MSQRDRAAHNTGSYYKSFNNVTGILAALVAASPLISSVLPSDLALYFFPPLGQINWLARIGAVVFTLLATYVAFFLRAGNSARRVVLAFGAGFVFFASFLLLTFRFVRTIDIPSQNSSVTVSVGFHKTEFAEKNFPSDTDWKMLRQRGTSDEEIERLWTPSSVAIARLALWVTCVGFLVACTFSLCFGVLLTASAEI